MPEVKKFCAHCKRWWWVERRVTRCIVCGHEGLKDNPE